MAVTLQAEPETSAAADFDTAALAAYLSDELGGDWSGIAARRFFGGQSNPTYLVEAGAVRCVLRRKPFGPLLPSAHAIEREYRVMQALAKAGVPVPGMRLYCADESVIGAPFFIMDHVPGRVVADPALASLAPGERAPVYDDMVRVLAAIHNVDLAEADLEDFGKPAGFLKRQVAGWTRQYRASETHTIDSMERLIAWLPENLPDDVPPRLVHGDYRLENLILAPERPAVSAVIDWELATIGDPLADLAHNCLPWHLPPEAFGGMIGRDAPGLPGERDYLARYCALTGRPRIEAWPTYVAFALFRLAAIMQGVFKRSLDGNASSPDAAARGRLASVCADRGWEAALAGR